MIKKPTPEELAEEAIKLLNQAEDLEEQGDWSKAIASYQKAADNLQQSGYLSHRIDDIYSRITEINNYLKEDKMYKQAQSQIQHAQVERLQDEAFSLLDEAKSQETAGLLDNAIQNYFSAIKLLAQSGWTETQLESLKSKIITLTETLESQKQSYPEVQAPIQPQSPLSEATVQPSVDKKAEAIKAYEEKKKREEEMQNKAFACIDEAKKFEKDKNSNEAITNYQKAIYLLNSLGWTQQTESLQAKVNKLKKEKGITQAQPQVDTPSLEKEPIVQPPLPQAELDLKTQKLLELEEKKKKEQEIQNKAFACIDEAKKFEKEKNFNEAITNYQKAIYLLNSLGWTQQTESIQAIVESLQKEKEIIQPQPQVDKASLEEEPIVQPAISQSELELKTQRLLELEERKKKEQEMQNQAFAYIDEAKKFEKDKNFNEAITNYQNAIESLNSLGWTQQTESIKVIVEMLKKEKEIIQTQPQVDTPSLEEEPTVQPPFPQAELDLKTQKLLELDEKKKKEEEMQNKAFAYIDEAKKFEKDKNFNEAITNYQNAIESLNSLGWTQQTQSLQAIVDKLVKEKEIIQ
ncbi:MAG: hypothetical protein EU529_16305, partial [Promethearchaeota archaeon]